MPPEYSEQAHWYAENIEPHEPLIRHWLKSRYGTQCDVDDVLQDALVRVWRRVQAGQLPLPPPSPIVFGEIRRRAIDLGRGADRRQRRELLACDDGNESTNGWFESHIE